MNKTWESGNVVEKYLGHSIPLVLEPYDIILVLYSLGTNLVCSRIISRTEPLDLD